MNKAEIEAIARKHGAKRVEVDTKYPGGVNVYVDGEADLDMIGKAVRSGLPSNFFCQVFRMTFLNGYPWVPADKLEVRGGKVWQHGEYCGCNSVTESKGYTTYACNRPSGPRGIGVHMSAHPVFSSVDARREAGYAVDCFGKMLRCITEPDHHINVASSYHMSAVSNVPGMLQQVEAGNRAQVIHVAYWGDDKNPGTKERPRLTLSPLTSDEIRNGIWLAPPGGAHPFGEYASDTLAFAMLKEQAESGGHSDDFALQRCKELVSLQLTLLKRFERDMGMVEKLGPGFAKTENDRRRDRIICVRDRRAK